MDREDMMGSLIERYLKTKMQEMSFTVSDMINANGPEDRVFLLLAMQNAVDAILPRLSEPEQDVFKLLRERTVTVTFPSEMDPRKRDGK